MIKLDAAEVRAVFPHKSAAEDYVDKKIAEINNDYGIIVGRH